MHGNEICNLENDGFGCLYRKCILKPFEKLAHNEEWFLCPVLVYSSRNSTERCRLSQSFIRSISARFFKTQCQHSC